MMSGGLAQAPVARQQGAVKRLGRPRGIGMATQAPRRLQRPANAIRASRPSLADRRWPIVVGRSSLADRRWPIVA
jgi:hypothetical protein